MIRSLMMKVLMKAEDSDDSENKKSENEVEEQTKETSPIASTAASAKEKLLGQLSQAKLFAAAQ
jgi:hypothetical protein